MNKTIIKIKLLALCFFITGGIMAQQKLTKVSQSIKVDKDVVVDLNTSYSNIIIDTWNKNTIEVEAYIEGEKLSKEDLEEALKHWDVDIDASNKEVSISTRGGHSNSLWVHRDSHDCEGCDHDNHNHSVGAILNELKFELADIPEMDFDFDFDFDFPEMPEMPEMPELPELPEGVNAIKFDYDAYQKNGEKYLEEWSQNFESRYGKDYAKKMEAWGKKFGEEWEDKYGKDYAKKMEAWGEKFGKEWGEKYAKQMEAWGENFAKRMESQAKQATAQVERAEAHKARAEAMKERAKVRAEAHKARAEAMKVRAKVRAEEHKKRVKERAILIKDREREVESLFHRSSHPDVKKTIKIKMPKGAKLKVNVKHGEIQFAANIDNLEADLQYTKFTAESINGSLTSINASYSPIYVANWNLGELNLNHVKNVELENVEHLVLNAVSSNIDVENLFGSAIIDGNIGDVKIFNIDDNFISLNMILQNNDTFIKLPNTDYNLRYKGTRSHLNHSEHTENGHVTNFSTGDLSSAKNIVINAKYSNVTME